MEELKVSRVDTSSKIVISRLRDLLDEMEETLVNSHCYISKERNKIKPNSNKELADALDYSMTSLSSIRQQREEIVNYMSEIRINYKISDKESKDNIEAIGRLKVLARHHKEDADKLREIVDNLNKKIIELESQPRVNNVLSPESKEYVNMHIGTNGLILGDAGMEVLAERIGKMLNLVETNVKSLAVGEYLKSAEYKEKASRTGEDAHRFNKDIDSDELVRAYIKADYKLTEDVLAQFKGMSYQGLRDRLIDTGTWKGRNK